MNVLLIFFAIPLAVIILSSILESFINCPLKVAGIFFSIFIVVAFALGGTAALIVAAIIYTIIAIITAAITRFIINRRCNCCGNRAENNTCNACNNCDSCNTCRNSLDSSINVFDNLNRFGASTDFTNTNALLESNNLTSRNTNNSCRRFR